MIENSIPTTLTKLLSRTGTHTSAPFPTESLPTLTCTLEVPWAYIGIKEIQRLHVMRNNSSVDPIGKRVEFLLIVSEFGTIIQKWSGAIFQITETKRAVC